jgi:cyanophycinase
MAEGTLIIIGGGEDKRGERVILREVAGRLNGDKLVIATIASQDPAPILTNTNASSASWA